MIIMRLTFILAFLLHAGSFEGAQTFAQDTKPVPPVAAHDLRSLANVYAELQVCREELAALRKIEKLSVSDYRKYSTKHLDSLLDALDGHRKRKSETEDYLNAVEQALHREIRFFRTAGDADVEAERAGWIGIRRSAIEEKMKTARRREMDERKRLALP